LNYHSTICVNNITRAALTRARSRDNASIGHTGSNQTSQEKNFHKQPNAYTGKITQIT